MRPIRPLLLASLLALPALASAQQAPPIEQAMSAEEFKATGLDKLSAAELAQLNTWLDRRVQQEASAAVAAATEQAREEGRREVVEKNRGFFHFNSEEPIESTIVGEFRGFASRRQYTLANGQVWEQTDGATLAGVRVDNPKVRIRPGAMGAWWMGIEGYNTQAKVKRVE